MDQFSHDLTIALEETSLLDRARVSRWGQQRRRTRSTGNLPCAPQPTEDSSSPTELVFGHAAGPQSHATNSYDGLDTQNVCLPTDSDDNDKEDVSLPRIACNKSTMSVAAIRLGTLESDSLNENFSPSRLFKPTARRKRKFKRISMYYDIMSSAVPTTSTEQKEAEADTEDTNIVNTFCNHNVTISGALAASATVTATATDASTPPTALMSTLTPATSIAAALLQQKDTNVTADSIKIHSPVVEATGVPVSLTLRKRGLKPEPMALSSGGSGGGRAQLFLCGKRKRLNRDRCPQEHHQDHSFSMPRYYTYLEEYRMRPRSFSSTSKPHSDRLLPLNKGLLSKIERIAQQQQQQQQQQRKPRELLMDDEEEQLICDSDSDTSEENSVKRSNREEVDENVDNLLNEDAGLETEDQLRTCAADVTAEGRERRKRSKKTPREQIDKTEVVTMMETSYDAVTTSSTETTRAAILSVDGKSSPEVARNQQQQQEQQQQPGNATVLITEEKSLSDRLELTDNQGLTCSDPQNANQGLESQFASYRIYRKKRFNDPNSNFYYPITDNVSRHLLPHRQHQHHQRQLQRLTRKGYQPPFYRDATGILQFTIDSPLQQQPHQQQGFAAMDCEDLNDFSSSSSLSSSESESGRPSVNDTDRDGDDELTDCPGNENMCGDALGKYEMKRKLLKRSTLPQIKSDPESSSAILTGEDDTIMSGSSTLESGGGGSLAATATTSAALLTYSNSNAALSSSAATDWNAVNFEHRLPFPCSEPITIASRHVSTTAIDHGLSFGFVEEGQQSGRPAGHRPPEDHMLHGGGLNTSGGCSFMTTPPPPPPLPLLKLSSTASSNASSYTATSPVEMREIRAGCRRVKLDRPGFSIKTSLNERLSRFLQDPQQLQMRLPDIESCEQDSLINLANLYSLQMSLDNGCAILNKTSNTTQTVNIEEQSLGEDSKLQDYKRRCYENKDNDLFHK